jgi:type IV pilus assembly protein PilY1
MTLTRNQRLRTAPHWLATAALTLFAAAPQAALIDLANAPLVVSTTNVVKPNLLFVLDDSGSMAWDYMPDYTRDAFCRSKGAGIDAGSNYSGTFAANCCSNNSTGSSNRGITLGGCTAGSAGTSPTFEGWRGQPLFMAAEFSGMAYNPSIRYRPPVKADGTEYPSFSSGWTAVPDDAYGIQKSLTTTTNLLTTYPDTEWCPTAASPSSDCLRNGNYILPGRVGGVDYTVFRAVSGSGSGNIVTGSPIAPTLTPRDFGPHYYRIVPSEYCTGPNLRSCSTTESVTHPWPAPVRWCNSDANARAATPAAGSCQANRAGAYTHARFPTKYFSAGTAGTPAVPAVPAKLTYTVSTSGCSGSGTRDTRVGPLMVGTVDLFGGTKTARSNSANTIASRMRDAINGATAATGGYSATVSGATVTVSAPVAFGSFTAAAVLSVFESRGTCTVIIPATPPTFGGYVAEIPATPGVPAGFPGRFERVDIVPSVTTYPKAVTRSDCAGATCTYTEEMTNFANWWAYYRTRMQTMKTSASRAFVDVNDRRRLGFMTLNKNNGAGFLNVADFNATQKAAWFNKLQTALPSGGTPLRQELSRAGRLFGGRLNGTSIGGVTATDPMQYSCQRNYTLLSSDGYWNGATGKQLDGTTDVGEQDGGLVRPMLDGRADANTLADVAAYYFKTDLRDGPTGVCTSGSSALDVCGTSTTVGVPSEVQNMRTFSLGLGAPGFMQFRSDYLTATTGDFDSVRRGVTADPASGVCAWQTGGICNWPQPVNDTLTAIDDLWHAAVNGEGTYFSAKDPDTLYTGIYNALTAIDVVESATAAATTSTPNITSADNQIFISSYKSGEWTGSLLSRRIDVATGAVIGGAPDWSAGALLDARSSSSRTVLMFSGGSPTKLKPFAWADLSSTEKNHFSLSVLTASGSGLAQFCVVGPYCLTSAAQSSAAGEPLVQFITGDRSNEGAIADPTKFFRQRTSVLGDIVNSEAVYVGAPNRRYTDGAYTSFKSAAASRTPMVYVGANDGMLHAFNATTGQELWAYVPTAVLPNLYRLADKEYGNKHRYYVDSTPTAQDVVIGGQWRTILVGGLGAGGRAYYALDVTDPANPKGLWEYSSTNNANLGFSYGRPIIGKLEDGTWAVFVASGYNNVSPGDGQGHVFVLDAATGALIRTISTGVGSTGTPSGLAHLRAWYDNISRDPTVARLYGGDNLGNLWRLDVNNNVGAAGYDAQRLAILMDGSGNPQPVTSRPELGKVGSNVMVYVGTGRYLGTSDLTSTAQQSIYAVKDRMTNEDYGNIRLPTPNFVKQTMALSTCPSGSDYCNSGDAVRNIPSPEPVNLATNGGFFVDLPVTSERVNTEPVLAFGTLLVTSNIIESGNVCRVGGSSWLNLLDYRTGASVPGTGLAGVQISNGIGSRATVFTLPNGKVRAGITTSDKPGAPTIKNFKRAAEVTETLRHSWREVEGD